MPTPTNARLGSPPRFVHEVMSEGQQRSPLVSSATHAPLPPRLRRTCNHELEHVRFEGGRAKAAALHPDELCMEMCKGFRDQMDYDAKGLKCLDELS